MALSGRSGKKRGEVEKTFRAGRNPKRSLPPREQQSCYKKAELLCGVGAANDFKPRRAPGSEGAISSSRGKNFRPRGCRCSRFGAAPNCLPQENKRFSCENRVFFSLKMRFERVVEPGRFLSVPFLLKLGFSSILFGPVSSSLWLSSLTAQAVTIRTVTLDFWAGTHLSSNLRTVDGRSTSLITSVGKRRRRNRSRVSNMVADILPWKVSPTSLMSSWH